MMKKVNLPTTATTAASSRLGTTMQNITMLTTASKR